MNGYEKRTLRKREQIIETAQSLFFKSGITDVTIEQIAKAAHVSRVTIFKYFEDKEGLVKEVVRTWVTSLLRGLDEILESNRPFQEKLSLIIRGFSSIRNQAVNRDIRGSGELLAYFREVLREEGLPKIMALIGQGKRDGSIDLSLDDEAILMYFSAFQPILSNPEYIKSRKEVQDSLFTMFMNGFIRNWR